MRRALLTLLLSLIAMTAAVSTASASAGQLLWQADGTRPISQEWSSFSFSPSQYCGGKFAGGSMPPSALFQVESNFVSPGQTHAYHFVLPDNSPCYTSSDRGEINMGNSPSSPWVAPDGTTRDMTQGENAWMAYWFYIPTHLTSNPSQRNVMGGGFPWHTILQWHNYGSGGPPLSVDAYDTNKMDFALQSCQTVGCSSGAPIATWAYTRDKWLKLVLHVNWSANGDGYVEVYGDMGDGQGFHQLTQRYTRWILKKDSSGNGASVFPTLGNYEMGCASNSSYCGTSEDYALGPFVGTTEDAATQKAFGTVSLPPPPTLGAAFTGPSASKVGQTDTFDASTSTGSPVSYGWTDGVNKLGTGQVLPFTFRYAGTKHILLTITGASGATATVEHDVTVS
jgi:hypothetical protein